MATTIRGRRSWIGDRRDDGHREFKLKWLIRSNDPENDGPATVMATSGLPLPGSAWAFGNDLDQYAFCKPSMAVRPHGHRDGERYKFWTAEQTFSTNPTAKCQDQQVENPLMEPQKKSGGTSKLKEEAVRDRFGNRILTSSWEPIRGAQNEWDRSTGTVKIEQNVAVLDEALCESLRDCVNATTLWGHARRCVKLSGFEWEERFWGLCNAYYVRRFEFEIDDRTFDRDLLDEGSKVLSGTWDDDTGLWTLIPIGGVTPDRFNPTHFIRYKDKNGENARVILDGAGQPWNPDQVSVAKWWCIRNSAAAVGAGLVIDVGYCFNGTCEAAFDEAETADIAAGAALGSHLVFGPFSSASECTAQCSGGSAPWLVNECAGPSNPGNRHTEKYHEANFLILGIPLTL